MRKMGMIMDISCTGYSWRRFSPSSNSEFIMELAGVTDISLRSTSGSLATRTMHRLGFGFSGKAQEWAEEPPGFEDLMRSRLTRHFRTWYSTARMCSCMLSLWTVKYGCRGIFTTIFIFLAFGDIIKSYTKTSQIAKCRRRDGCRQCWKMIVKTVTIETIKNS